MFFPQQELFLSLSFSRECTLPSRFLKEIWFSSHRSGSSILRYITTSPHLQQSAHSTFELLRSLGPKIIQSIQENQGLPCELVLKREDFLRELAAFQALIQKEQGLPKRYFFTPYLSLDTPLPKYSKRKLRTGLLQSGFDLCFINRNWDGLDRIEDLTHLDFFEDGEGTIRVLGIPLSEHLGAVLESWLAILEQHPKEGTVRLLVKPELKNRDQLALEVLQRAENWRLSHQVGDYSFDSLEKAERFLKDWVKKTKKITPGAIARVAEMGTYLGEVMRGMWGGYYRSLQDEPLEDDPHSDATSGYALELPFDRTVFPIVKVLESFKLGRALPLRLHIEVIQAHHRQGALFKRIERELYQDELNRRKAALRILCDIFDLRVDSILADYLLFEEEPELLMRAMERLQGVQIPLDLDCLKFFAVQDDDRVSARALSLLAKQQYSGLPELIQQLLKGKKRSLLRPLARKLLEDLGSKEAKKALRALGPIPILASGQRLIPGQVHPPGRLPLLAEILEDCANPNKLEAAIRILSIFPNDLEPETFGSALADPSPRLRMDAIGLLALSDRPIARKLLKGRLMLEKDPLVTALLKEAIALFPDKDPDADATTIISSSD